MQNKSIDQRLADSRDRALARVYTGRTSVVADRPQVQIPGQKAEYTGIRVLVIAIIAVALVALMLSTTGVAATRDLQIRLFAFTAGDATESEFAVGIQMGGSGSSKFTPAQWGGFLSEALGQAFTSFQSLSTIRLGEAKRVTYIATFTKQQKLTAVAEVIQESLAPLGGCDVIIAFAKEDPAGRPAKITQ